MWRLSSTFLAVICMAAVAHGKGLEKPADKPVTGKISWVFDYQKAKEMARDTGKPLFIVFRCER